jgi:hypothetical protein
MHFVFLNLLFYYIVASISRKVAWLDLKLSCLLCLSILKGIIEGGDYNSYSVSKFFFILWWHPNLERLHGLI